MLALLAPLALLASFACIATVMFSALLMLINNKGNKLAHSVWPLTIMTCYRHGDITALLVWLATLALLAMLTSIAILALLAMLAW